jgi:DNA-directed RNA polymerase specialized sigma24 family protein
MDIKLLIPLNLEHTRPMPGIISNAEIVRLIMDDDPLGSELLYNKYHLHMLYRAKRQSPNHAEDLAQDTLMKTIEQVRDGLLENSGGLSSYINMILLRRAWNDNRVRKMELGSNVLATVMDYTSDKTVGSNPDMLLMLKERSHILRVNMMLLTELQRDILSRCLQGQPRSKIMKEMHLNENAFRLLKSRSKLRLEGLVAEDLHLPPLTSHN